MAVDPGIVGWLTSLVIIIFIDLVLAGDNAVVIAMAASKLPVAMQRKAVFYGTFCAIAVRVLMTLVVFWIINLPAIRAIGGLFLFWIAYRMMVGREKEGNVSSEAHSFLEAVKVIVVADTVMGFDNILAIAGAAEGDFILIIIGLVISIPIMVWGSMFLLGLIKRHPQIIFFGGGILGYVAAKMLLGDPIVLKMLGMPKPGAVWMLIAVLTLGTVAAGWLVAKKRASAETR